MTTLELEVLEPLTLSERHTVVLIDDEPAVLSALRRVFRAEPYEIRTTSIPEVAMEWARQGVVSLVITDQRMPEMCGTDLAERLRRLSPKTVCILLTAYPGNELVQHGLSRDVDWLVSKPWNDDALRLTVRRLLRDLERRPPGVVEIDAKAASGALAKAVRRVAGALIKGAGWVSGFLWIPDAGGHPRW
jgi:response regulator RpfG family c-di-GMP phosphodiesterase